MVLIYLIEDINGLKYVGSTCKTLKQRLENHRTSKKRKKFSSHKLDLDNCEISVIEECSEDIRKERENYHIQNTDCVNILNADFDRKSYMRQYRAKNREKIREKNRATQRNYYDKNRDKIAEYERNVRIYKNSWGGSWKRGNDLNNLLLIRVDLFQ